MKLTRAPREHDRVLLVLPVACFPLVELRHFAQLPGQTCSQYLILIVVEALCITLFGCCCVEQHFVNREETKNAPLLFGTVKKWRSVRRDDG